MLRLRMDDAGDRSWVMHFSAGKSGLVDCILGVGLSIHIYLYSTVVTVTGLALLIHPIPLR